MTLSPYFTAEQVAALLQISLRSVFNHVGSGLLPQPIRLGNLRLWPQQALHDHVCLLSRKPKKKRSVKRPPAPLLPKVAAGPR